MWKLVHRSEFSLPSNPLDETIKNKLRQLVSIFVSEQVPFKATDQLQPFSVSKQYRLVPNPDWHQALKELDEKYKERIKQEISNKFIDVISAQPFSSISGIIERWKNKNNYFQLDYPEIADIIEEPDKWMDKLTIDSKFVIINGLEHYYLTHHLGFGLVKRLFQKLSEGDLSYLIICNSWAFNYLITTNFFSTDNFGNMYYIQPLRGTDLRMWIKELTRFYKRKNISFRTTNTGEHLIKHDEDDELTSLSTKYFEKLTAYSLGIPAIALEFWRNGLRVNPDEQILKELEEEIDEDTEETVKGETTIWILPWEKLPKLTLDKILSTEEELILWYLLLHQPLSKDVLSYLMINYTSNLSPILFKLEKQKLIVIENDKIQVNSLGYPSIAKYLKTEGYLTDDLLE